MGTQEGLKKFIIEICRENLFKVILRTTICDILLYRYPDVLLIQFCCNYDCQNISRALEWIKKPTYTEKNLFSIATIYDILYKYSNSVYTQIFWNFDPSVNNGTNNLFKINNENNINIRISLVLK